MDEIKIYSCITILYNTKKNNDSTPLADKQSYYKFKW